MSITPSGSVKGSSRSTLTGTRIGRSSSRFRIRVVKSVVGEENFIEMWPNKSNNFCCGGGGGFLQSGFTDERRAYGKIKFDQIIATGADYCIAACHNCHAQIHDLADHYEGKYHTVHLWTLIALSLGILGPNEREYLGDDLQEVNMPEE